MDDGVGESRKRKEHVRERRGLERFWRKRAPVWPPRWPRKWTQIQGRIIGQRPLCRGENQIEFVSEEFALFSFLECHPVKNLFKHSRSTRFIRDNWADPSKRNDESVSLFQIFHRPFSVRSNLIIWILGTTHSARVCPIAGQIRFQVRIYRQSTKGEKGKSKSCPSSEREKTGNRSIGFATD